MKILGRNELIILRILSQLKSATRREIQKFNKFNPNSLQNSIDRLKEYKLINYKKVKVGRGNDVEIYVLTNRGILFNELWKS